MTDSEAPRYSDFIYERVTYTLKEVGSTMYVSLDGAPLGVLHHDSKGYYKPGSENRHAEWDSAVRLTIRGDIR